MHFMSVADPLVITNRIRINTLALAARLPTMHGTREYVEAGGLMSYGPNLPDLFRRAADFVDKILRGAKPADIPVEQPTKFDLVINLTTAKALGLDRAADAARPRRRGDRIERENCSRSRRRNAAGVPMWQRPAPGGRQIVRPKRVPATEGAGMTGGGQEGRGNGAEKRA